MALTVYVLRHPLGDFTAGGPSARHDQIIVVNANGPGYIERQAVECPSKAFMLVPNPFNTVALVRAENLGTVDRPEWAPLRKDGHVGPMAGGNFAHTSDSRFGEKCREIIGRSFYGAVAIHDRFETAAEYAALST